MYVDPHLARGLTQSFWTYVTEEAGKLLPRLIAASGVSAHDLSNAKQAARFFGGLTAVADKSPIVLHKEITGKRNSAVWWALYLDCDPAHPFDSWQEKALRFEVDRVWAVPRQRQPTWLNTLVGEHCISRLFQRLPWPGIEAPRSPDILSELRELALVAQWYDFANFHISHQFKGKRLSLFIPTSHGAFLGIANPTDEGLHELRTFISTKQMRPEQLELWQQLREVHARPEIAQYLHALFDPTFRRFNATANTWMDTGALLVARLMNHAALLQDEYDAIKPSEIAAKFGDLTEAAE